MLDTMKIKNTMIWLFLFLQEFILITGRTISILAPVVPIQLDNSVPNARSADVNPRGEPARSPSMVMLPDTQNSPKKEDNKSKIVIYDTVKDCLSGIAHTINDGKRNHHQKDPHSYHMRLMCFPPLCFDKRHDRNAEQKSRKRNAEPDRHRCCCFPAGSPYTCRPGKQHRQQHSQKCY